MHSWTYTVLYLAPKPVQIERVDFNAFIYFFLLLLFFFAAKFVDSKLRAGNKVEDESVITFKQSFGCC